MSEKQSTVARTRRSFLTGRIAEPAEHIASVLIQARPERLAEVESAVSSLPGVESHGASEAGKLIVTLETRSDAALVDRMNRIQTTDWVITASLVYHYEGVLEDER
jgi:nitrate reductase NapD